MGGNAPQPSTRGGGDGRTRAAEPGGAKIAGRQAGSVARRPTGCRCCRESLPPPRGIRHPRQGAPTASRNAHLCARSPSANFTAMPGPVRAEADDKPSAPPFQHAAWTASSRRVASGRMVGYADGGLQAVDRGTAGSVRQPRPSAQPAIAAMKEPPQVCSHRCRAAASHPRRQFKDKIEPLPGAPGHCGAERHPGVWSASETQCLPEQL